MLSSKEKDTLLQCISAGVLLEVLQRDDMALEAVKRREQGSRLYLDKETGELVSYAEMKARGGLETAPVEVKREPPVQTYFERDMEKDTVTCLMSQTLFYAGLGRPDGKKGYHHPEVSSPLSVFQISKQMHTGKKADHLVQRR